MFIMVLYLYFVDTNKMYKYIDNNNNNLATHIVKFCDPLMGFRHRYVVIAPPDREVLRTVWPDDLNQKAPNNFQKTPNLEPAVKATKNMENSSDLNKSEGS